MDVQIEAEEAAAALEPTVELEEDAALTVDTPAAAVPALGALLGREGEEIAGAPEDDDDEAFAAGYDDDDELLLVVADARCFTETVLLLLLLWNPLLRLSFTSIFSC